MKRIRIDSVALLVLFSTAVAAAALICGRTTIYERSAETGRDAPFLIRPDNRRASIPGGTTGALQLSVSF